jgi:hypothetical protein
MGSINAKGQVDAIEFSRINLPTPTNNVDILFPSPDRSKI